MERSLLRNLLCHTVVHVLRFCIGLGFVKECPGICGYSHSVSIRYINVKDIRKPIYQVFYAISKSHNNG